MPDEEPPILRVSGLTKYFTNGSHWTASLFKGRSSKGQELIKAVDEVSFEVARGEVFGLLGESGCGKTTLARVLLRLVEPTAGAVGLDGTNIFRMSAEDLRRKVRPRMRMIFQHPDAALNPAYTVSMILDQALRVHTDLNGKERQRRAEELLAQVELPSSYLSKYPRELSGGQKRRIGICRALATQPDVIVADEPFSGLDVSLQEQVVRLFREIQQEHALTVILISHDVGLVTRLCNTVGIMRDGRLVEVLGEGKMTPSHCEQEYAAALLQAHLDARQQR